MVPGGPPEVPCAPARGCVPGRVLAGATGWRGSERESCCFWHTPSLQWLAGRPLCGHSPGSAPAPQALSSMGVPARGATGLQAGPPAQGAAAWWRAFLESLLGWDSDEAPCAGERGRPQRGGSGAARVPPAPDSAAAPGAQGTLSALRVALPQPQCPHR